MRGEPLDLPGNTRELPLNNLATNAESDFTGNTRELPSNNLAPNAKSRKNGDDNDRRRTERNKVNTKRSNHFSCPLFFCSSRTTFAMSSKLSDAEEEGFAVI